MERYLNFAHQTETKSRQETERMCKVIIQQLEELIGLNINLKLGNGLNMSNLNAITTILLLPDYLQYRDLLIKLLKQNNVNERGLLLHLLGIMNQFETTISFDSFRNKWITSFSTLPYHQDISWDNDKIKLQTKYGNITIYRYDKIVNNSEVYKIMRTSSLANYCHSNVGILKDYYLEDYIVTSEVPTLFGGYMYHSYFSTSEGTVDISNNMFYPNDDFNAVFQPNEILRIKSSEFALEYAKLVKEKGIIESSACAPVLVMALNNKMKNWYQFF